MPKGPRGEKRPADAVGLAVLVGKIATGEVEDTAEESKPKDQVRGGQSGGKARAEKLSPEDRSEAARRAATSRWSR